MKFKFFVFAISSLVVGCFSLHAQAAQRQQVRIVGSATVYPFVTAAAEQFGQAGDFRTPIVEATGTGGGFKLFCNGVGLHTADMNNASRRIMPSERENCDKNGVKHIIELPIGYDGIVMAQKKGAEPMNLNFKHLFMALARDIPDANGTLMPNPYHTWREIDPALPNSEIRVYGPPPTSGTRDTFAELAMEKGCAEFAGFARAYPDEKTRKKKCHLLREDGKYVESGENYNIIVQKLISDPHALGIVGFGFYDENMAKIQASRIAGITPTQESIAQGQYVLARTLFVYAKGEHLPLVPGFLEFMEELTSEGAGGGDGYMNLNGLVPLNAQERQKLQRTILGLRASRDK